MATSFRNTFKTLRPSSRLLATTVSLPQGTSIPTVAPVQVIDHRGALRPHLRVPVNPNHGLYGFFRVKTDGNSHRKPSEGGPTEYVALEPPIPAILRQSGRAWEATELRRKSFKDLHTLWYILLRERNLLATQAAERKRIQTVQEPNDTLKEWSCRKSMARIKVVLSERRYAYLQALRLRRALRRNPELGRSQSTEEEGANSILESGEEEKPARETT